jgi:hypothetical protein
MVKSIKEVERLSQPHFCLVRITLTKLMSLPLSLSLPTILEDSNSYKQGDHDTDVNSDDNDKESKIAYNGVIL